MNSIKIYHYESYKEYLKDLMFQGPANGRGQYQKLAKHLSVHSTLVSQILSGSKDFSLEQAYKVTTYFGLGELETEYFMLLVHLAKAGTQELGDHYKKRLEALKMNFLKVSSRIKAKKKLEDSDKALYYSDWAYIGIWLATSIDGLNTTEAISERLNIPLAQTAKLLDFLVKVGLCLEENGRYKMEETNTHLESTSVLIRRHHTNWRLKAMERYQSLSSEELAFTAPMSLSKKDFAKLKASILDLIEETGKRVKVSPAEELACLNIDLFFF